MIVSFQHKLRCGHLSDVSVAVCSDAREVVNHPDAPLQNEGDGVLWTDNPDRTCSACGAEFHFSDDYNVAMKAKRLARQRSEEYPQFRKDVQK